MTDRMVGAKKADLDTPVLLVDLDKFESNIRRLSSHCKQHSVGWRPHSKAHKSPQIARLLMQAGAAGITCAKLAEAEVMVDHGLDNLLIANSIVTPPKQRRLAALQQRARVLSTVDNSSIIASMGAAGSAHGTEIPVLVDVDIGMNRAGVESSEAALDLARAINTTAGLRFAGIMGYEGHVLDVQPREEKVRQCHQALDKLVETRDLLQSKGIEVPIVSAGGTGSYDITASYPGITEIQAGGGIFMDNLYRHTCHVADLDLALSVLTTVTSRHRGHIVTDAGFKTMSSVHQPPSPVGRDDLEMRYLSAEHGVWDLKAGQVGPNVGEQIEFVVGYSDSTNFLHDCFVGVRGGQVETVWPLAGRGKLT